MGILSMLAGDAVEGAGKGVASAVEAVGNVVDKLFTSDDERLSRAEVMERLKQQPDMAQVEINKIEAAHPSVFVAGWRPAVGWVCVASLAAYYPPRFIAATVLWIMQISQTGVWSPPPEVGVSDILGLVGSLLGMSWLRTHEKKAGVA